MRKIAIAFLWLVLAPVLAAGPAAAQLLPNVNLVFTPFHKNGIYRIGERAGWTIHALLGAGYTRYHYELRENNFTVLKSGTLDLASGGVHNITDLLFEFCRGEKRSLHRQEFTSDDVG